MDYQCECGEEFDIYDEKQYDCYFDVNSTEDYVNRYFSVHCPKCGKPVKCAEYFTYDRTIFMQ